MYWIIGVIAGIILFVLLCMACCCYVVSESEAIVIERFGRFDRVLQPGCHCVCPCASTPRKFPWNHSSCDGYGNIIDQVSTDYRIDTRESIFQFPPTEVYTKDTLIISITSVMFYRIVDVKKANYEVDDLLGAMLHATSTTLKEAFGQMSLHEALECQDFINDYLIREFAHHFDKWGVEVTRIELLNISPGGQDRSVLDAMRTQMVAERRRRGDFIKSEGEKVAQNIIADAHKTITRIDGISEQEATKRLSEGRASSTVLLAQAEKSSLDAISHITNIDKISYTDFFLTKQFISMLGNIATHSGSNFMILPYEPAMFSGPLHSHVSTVFGRYGTIAKALTTAKLPEPTLTTQQLFSLPPLSPNTDAAGSLVNPFGTAPSASAPTEGSMGLLAQLSSEAGNSTIADDGNQQKFSDLD